MSKGFYQLILYKDKESKIKIGKKGDANFPEKDITYTLAVP
ncbi:MAG: hypothetical protein V1890_04045 [Candidatus Zixiibacteriota bacterium]